MSRITIQTKTGPYTITGHAFSYTVGSTKHKLAYHKAETGTAITHLASGLRVTGFTDVFLAACLGDWKAAAKHTMDNFVKEYGAERINAKLAAAKPLEVIP
jgi:hypothetical protein